MFTCITFTIFYLAQIELQEESWDSNDGKHEEVRDEEGASTVFETQIGEAPDIAEPHSVAETREQEVQLPSPVSSLRVLILLELEFVPRLALPLQQK